MYADQSREHFRVNNTVKPAVLAEFIVSSRNEGATVSKEAVKNLSMFIHNITIKSPHNPLNGGTIDHVCAQWNGNCFVETMLSDPTTIHSDPHQTEIQTGRYQNIRYYTWHRILYFQMKREQQAALK